MEVGDRILDYLIAQKLGDGGMGQVYLARHTVLDQLVAVKVLDPEVARKSGVIDRFIQEANIQAKLEHPGIVRVLTATQITGGTLALLMEYVQGSSLFEVLEERGSLPVEHAIDIMAQVFSAVGYAHSMGVIHRDLKPSNIMLMASGDVKVTDFGIAKVVGATRLTSTGATMGTAHYMSPEQIQRPKTIDQRSDIYALGCVFYELLTGQPPYGANEDSNTESDFQIKMAHVYEGIAPPSDLNARVPRWLDELVMQLLQKDREARPASCEDVLNLMDSKTGQEPSTRRKRKSPMHTRPSGGSRRTVVMAGSQVFFSSKVLWAVAGIVSTGLFVFFMSHVGIFGGKNKDKVLIVDSVDSNQVVKGAARSSDSAAGDSDQQNFFTFTEGGGQENAENSTSAIEQKYLEMQSIKTIKKLMQTWSESDQKAYAFLEFILDEKIIFYNVIKNKNEILREKVNFMAKWNVRSYVARDDAYKIACDVQTRRCDVSGVFDWKAISHADSLNSEGVASFEYGLDFSGEAPKIYKESGKVIQRNMVKI